MSKVEELEKLFEEWKEKQKQEGKKLEKEKKIDKKEAKKEEEKKSKNTIQILKVNNESFTYDGFVFEEKEGTVLYILCESNLGLSAKANDEFWFKGVYKIKNNVLKIPRRIEKMQEYLCEKIPGLKNTDISYMNINKRGGFGNCDLEILENYYFEYQKNICKEIEIIKPKVIVYCARSEDIYEDLISNISNEIIKIKMWHPSCRRGDEAYIEEFKERCKRLF